LFIIDAHLDLGMNAMEWNRDLRKRLSEINEREKKLSDKPDRGKATVSLPELRKGNIGLVVATQIARAVDPGNILPGWNSPEQAWAQIHLKNISHFGITKIRCLICLSDIY
jgi:membrane dipeptidase